MIQILIFLITLLKWMSNRLSEEDCISVSSSFDLMKMYSNYCTKMLRGDSPVQGLADPLCPEDDPAASL